MTRPRTLAVLVLGTLLCSGVDPVGAADFFLDDFEDGDAFDGSPVKWAPYVPPWGQGTAEVKNGDFVLTPDPDHRPAPGSPNYTEIDYEVEGPVFSDVSVRTQARGLADGYFGIAVFARDMNYAGTNAGLSGWLRTDNLLEIAAYNDTGWARSVNVPITLSPWESDVHLQMDVAGDDVWLSAWADGTEKPATPQVHMSLPAFLQGVEGRVGVYNGNVMQADGNSLPSTPVAFRHFEAAQVERDVAGAGQPGPMPVSGDISGGQLGPVEGVQPGLLQRWFSVSNPLTYDNVIENVYDPTSPGTSLEPDVPAFHSAHTWWTGTDTRVSGTTNYPAEIWGHPRTQDIGDWNSSDNERYTVALEGEIFIPESGKYRFVDGIDDLAVFGIDLNRDGVVDPGQDELLIDDNIWTSVDRSQNAGGLPSNVIPSATFSDIAPGGEWFKVQSFVAEGEIGDAGIFYWDYDAADLDGDGIRLGDAPGFPTSARGNGRTIAGENLSNLFIPDTHLRSQGGQALIAGQVDAKLAQAIYKFELGTDGTYDELSVERPAAAVTTKLDLNDATLELLALGEPKLGEYRLLVADQLQGKASLTIPESLVPWLDTSQLLSEGLLAVVLPGDANADHKVDLSDFGILKEQFGAGTTRAQGDFNSDAKVDLTDFGILKEHFGRTGAAAVPEPSGLLLAGLAMLGWAGSAPSYCQILWMGIVG